MSRPKRHSSRVLAPSKFRVIVLRVTSRVPPPRRNTATSIHPQQHFKRTTKQSHIYDSHTRRQKKTIMSEATPRITAPYLEQFSHQTVRILGKVRQLRGEQATIDAGGQVSVFLNRVSFIAIVQEEVSQVEQTKERKNPKRSFNAKSQYMYLNFC
jgi:mevalonate pyrophosphate decarboxylase